MSHVPSHSASIMDQVPVEVMERIFSRLSSRWLKTATLVCRSWNNVAHPYMSKRLRVRFSAKEPDSTIRSPSLVEQLENAPRFASLVGELVLESHEGLDLAFLDNLVPHIPHLQVLSLRATHICAPAARTNSRNTTSPVRLSQLALHRASRNTTVPTSATAFAHLLDLFTEVHSVVVENLLLASASPSPGVEWPRLRVDSITVGPDAPGCVAALTRAVDPAFLTYIHDGPSDMGSVRDIEHSLPELREYHTDAFYGDRDGTTGDLSRAFSAYPALAVIRTGVEVRLEQPDRSSGHSAIAQLRTADSRAWIRMTDALSFAGPTLEELHLTLTLGIKDRRWTADGYTYVPMKVHEDIVPQLRALDWALLGRVIDNQPMLAVVHVNVDLNDIFVLNADGGEASRGVFEAALLKVVREQCGSRSTMILRVSAHQDDDVLPNIRFGTVCCRRS